MYEEVDDGGGAGAGDFVVMLYRRIGVRVRGLRCRVPSFGLQASARAFLNLDQWGRARVELPLRA